MAPKLTLRNPPSANPAAIAAFVDAGEDSPSLELASPAPLLRSVPSPVSAPDVVAASPATATATATIAASSVSFERASKSIVHRRTKPAARRTSVYFDLDVVERLAAVVQASDKDMSTVVNELLRPALGLDVQR
ncbi:MAG TPA: hypothetical protein VGM90_16395 [Kofleriaceae bacterium]|jgi:hypothetical protein